MRLRCCPLCEENQFKCAGCETPKASFSRTIHQVNTGHLLLAAVLQNNNSVQLCQGGNSLFVFFSLCTCVYV